MLQDNATVRVMLLGGFRVVAPGRGDVTPPGGVVAQALKLLGVHGSLHVEQLIEGLWPDCDAATGRTRLRNVASRLRRACGDLVVREGDTVRLAGHVVVDAAAFETEADAVLNHLSDRPVTVARAALARYRGDLLPFDLYADWAAVPRERLRRRYLALLDRLVDDACARGAGGEAVALLERAIEAEPDDEGRYVTAARCLLQDGHRGRSVLMLRRARAAGERLGLPPSPELALLEGDLAGSRVLGAVPA